MNKTQRVVFLFFIFANAVSYQNCSKSGFDASVQTDLQSLSDDGAGNPTLPPPAPSAPGDYLTTLKLSNRLTVNNSTAQQITFGQVFAPGELPAGASLSGKIKNQVVALQVDKKATHADGSLKHAAITVQVPAMMPSEQMNLKLYNAASALSGREITADDILATAYDMQVSIVMNGVTSTASARQALMANKATAGVWLKGPLVSEFNVSQALNEFIHVYFDIRLYQDGKIKTDVTLTNDWAYKLGVKTFTYDVNIKQAGVAVFAKSAQKHHRFANWKKTFYYNGFIPPIYVQREAVHWRKSKAILNYALNTPIAESVLLSTYRDFLSSDRQPMESSLIEKYMPGTGGRADIGPETKWSALYTISQDVRMYDVIMGQADAGGSIPMYYRDPVTKLAVTRDRHPEIWTDSRCGTGPDCPVEAWDTRDTGWDVDTAHQPSLYYLPYMITADRYYLEAMQMQAAGIINNHNPTYFTKDGKFYFNSGNDQVRAGAWSLRTVANAAYLTPDNDPLKAYLNKIVDNDLELSYERLVVNDTAMQGDLAGYIWGVNVGSSGEFAPWQDDFHTMIYGYLYQRGFAKAKRMMDWKENFTAGRFLKSDFEFCANNGPGYYYKIKPSVTRLKTWRELHNATYGLNAVCPTAMDGYPNWGGGYAAGAMAANATLAQHGYVKAKQAVDLIKARTSFWNPTETNGYVTEPTYAISPVSVDALVKPAEPGI